MKMFFSVLLFAGPSMLATSSPSLAASPAYCALYGREYAAARIGTPAPKDAAGALQRLEDQAYYRCLNLDDDPEFPDTSAYFGASADEIVGTAAAATDVGGPYLDTGEGDASVGDETDATVDPSPAPPKTRTASAGSGSRLKAWTPEWTLWCKAHYKSFNAHTGMVLTFSGEKKLCP